MELLKIKKRKLNKNLLTIIIGLIIIVISSSVLIYNYCSNQKLEKIEEKSIEAFFEEPITEDEENQIENTPKEEKETTKIDYIGVLEIPKISLKKGLVDKNSYYNNVNRNIYILKETTFPSESENSHIILASHSGTSSVSYFKNLNKLSLNDEVYFYYENIKYVYQIINRYEIEKTGTMNLKLTNESDITLVTCISRTNKQVVFVGKLISKENF